MSWSFFTGTDAEVYTGSKAFAVKITASPGLYGLQSSDASAYAVLSDAYAASYLAARNPETRTKGRVTAKNDAKSALRAMAASLAKKIDGTPTVTDEQKIDLGLSVRGAPTSRPAPGKVTSFTVTLDQRGALNLTWKCPNPTGAGGTVYLLSRRIGLSGELTSLGVCGRKAFVDVTLPLGSSRVTYQIQAMRSTKVGPCAQFNVNFGMVDGDAIPNTPARIAA